jgi:hypothetical protein
MMDQDRMTEWKLAENQKRSENFYAELPEFYKRTKLLGGFYVGIKEANQAKQVGKLLERFIAR